MNRRLLVEDDERIADFVAQGLGAEGYAIEIATTGEDGLARAKSEGFDAIILDVMLPGMSGREVCRRLRESGLRTPIMMLTALDSVQDIVRGLRFGADEYVTKPFAFDELVARMEALIRRSTGGAAAIQPRIMKVGDLEFDREALLVRRGGRQIELTSTEYALLELLMSQSGKVVSRARIIENVWGTSKDPLTNVVEVYVGRLRSKIASDGQTDLIKTIRGRGYRMAAAA